MINLVLLRKIQVIDINLLAVAQFTALQLIKNLPIFLAEDLALFPLTIQKAIRTNETLKVRSQMKAKQLADLVVVIGCLRPGPPLKV